MSAPLKITREELEYLEKDSLINYLLRIQDLYFEAMGMLEQVKEKFLEIERQV